MERRRGLHMELLEGRCLFAANPIITEFSASNNGAIHDGHGASSDWVEIYNSGDESIDLVGYRLTDNLNNLDKWQFPSVVLEPGEYLVVFASGNDELDPAGNLHTNFSLSADGEELALVTPGGVIVSQFGEGGIGFPPQPRDDAVYGLAFDTLNQSLITPGSTGRLFVPTDNSVDATWMHPEFDDSSWQESGVSLGRQGSSSAYGGLIDTVMPNGTRSVYVRMEFTIENAEAFLDKLRLKYDDGFVAYINGVEVARANVPAELGFDSLASSLRVREAAVEYAAFDVKDFSHLLMVGENVLAIHVMSIEDDDLLLVPELSIATGSLSTPQLVGHLIHATPGLPNSQILASDVAFSRRGGVFSETFQLELVADGPGDIIRYTTDGTLPGPESLIYEGPITISSSMLIRARTYGTQGQLGSVFGEAYTLVDAEFAEFSSDLPIIVLENMSGGIPNREWQDAYFALYEVNEVTGRSELTSPADITTRIGQHRRGNSSYNDPKFNLRVELRDEAGEDRDISLLGMPAESDWILHAPYDNDRTLLRNAVIYDFSEQMGDYAIRTRYVEVFSNNNGGSLDGADYMGVYVLMETIKIDSERVDIGKLEPTENSEPGITGGYIIKFDRETGDEDDTFHTTRGTPHLDPVKFVHVDPERSELTAEQVDYIRNYLEEFESVLYGPDWKDPDIGYAAYIDVDSWIDHLLLRKFSKEKDEQVFSEYFYKPENGKLGFGPVWDFNNSTGVYDEPNYGPDTWSWRTTGQWNYEWFARLWNDSNFTQKFADRWQELRATVFSEENIIATMERHASQVAEAQERNYSRWPQVAPDGGPLADPGLTGWEAEVSNMQNWLLERAAWIDTRVLPPPILSEEGYVEAGTLVQLIHPQGGVRIYYTLDGTDPRASGGAVASNAVLYVDPLEITQATQVQARAYVPSTGQWSRLIATQYATEIPASAANLRLTELHYHPSNPSSNELAQVPGIEDNDFEFLELTNTSTRTIDLSGLRFTTGIEFDFAAADITTLAPGQAVVLVTHRAAFEARYGNDVPIAGQYGGRLGNSDDQITLVDGNGELVFFIDYLDESPWPSAADGDGPSLQVIDPRSDPNDPTNWTTSAVVHGSPGVAPGFLSGDYDLSGTVDQNDYAIWRAQFGQQVAVFGAGADGNGDGIIDAADYTIWRNNLGASLPAAAGMVWASEEVAAGSVDPAEGAQPGVPPVGSAGYAPMAHVASSPFGVSGGTGGGLGLRGEGKVSPQANELALLLLTDAPATQQDEVDNSRGMLAGIPFQEELPVWDESSVGVALKAIFGES